MQQKHFMNLTGQVGRAPARLSLEREVCDSNLGSIKLKTVLPTARHRCNISSKRSLLAAGAMTRGWAPQTRYPFGVEQRE